MHLHRRGQICDHASQFVTATDKDFRELLASSGSALLQRGKLLFLWPPLQALPGPSVAMDDLER